MHFNVHLPSSIEASSTGTRGEVTNGLALSAGCGRAFLPVDSAAEPRDITGHMDSNLTGKNATIKPLNISFAPMESKMRLTFTRRRAVWKM